MCGQSQSANEAVAECQGAGVFHFTGADLDVQQTGVTGEGKVWDGWYGIVGQHKVSHVRAYVVWDGS
jgi:hypothetical protein